ncbi:tumor necrosis factor receptor superfamily member 9a isoform X1 [Cyprinodon tularosa]|uniref:tumor necrosis factor receptor superfamily member 9a isoform X1 n=1 Tax=Cyprinodon tularosa TaxID=77115 RepID=UPI0018E28640|nr:tumor necrosis factor receptor superfamily member 9a isoform X1 [Cyprinodon tularosa]
MARIFWMMGFVLLPQGFLYVLGETGVGCKKWRSTDEGVCCDECHPGNRVVKRCGPNPTELCTPCERDHYTLKTLSSACSICSQCVGALVQLKACTRTSNTQCGCPKGLLCGDNPCTFCVDECSKGFEPNIYRSCTPCPNGTFNDKIHQKCKPLSTSCKDPNHVMVFKGNASSDIICKPPSTTTSTKTPPLNKSRRPVETTEQGWPTVLFVIIGAFMMCLIIFITLASFLIHHKGKKEKKQRTLSKTPIIGTPTDDPRTLIAIECSFHEAQQEQGNSTESLISKDSGGTV